MARDPKFDDGFSEMLPAPLSHGIGHNQGPEWLPIGKELEDRLKAAHKKAMKRADELIDAPAIAKVENPTQLKKATERVRQYQASLTELDGQRKAEKEPYRLGGAQVDGFFNEKAEELALLKIGLERLMNGYNTKVARDARIKAAAEAAEKRAAEAEAARKAKEKADKAAAAAAKAKGAKSAGKAARLAVEAEAAAEDHQAARVETVRAERQLHQPAANLTRARSANAVSSQQEFVDFRDLDRNKISLEQLRPYLGIDHLAQAVRAYIAANNDALKEDLKNRRQPLAGVEFFMNSRTRVGGG